MVVKKKTPKAKAKQYIKKYNTYNPFVIAELENINIYYEHLGAIKSYANSCNNIISIHINQELAENERRVACAYELGFISFYTQTVIHILDGSRYDKEILEFALCFCIIKENV